MPPSLPTGTVSRTSAGTRTFPPESDRARAPAASTQPGRTSQAQPPSATTPDLPSAVVPRREHDVAVSREHERVAELERENEALRDYIEAQADERQAVIERYERLLEQRDAEDGRADRPAATPTTSTTPTTPSGTSRTADRLAGVRTTLSALRSRVARRLGLG